LHFHSTVSRDGRNAVHRDDVDLGQTTEAMTLRIERSVRQGFTVFTLSGRITAEQVAELKGQLCTDCRNIILDLREVRLVDRDVVKFLSGCEADGMMLENCPAYVREWMDREEG
jgi:hypothetical protein